MKTEFKQKVVLLNINGEKLKFDPMTATWDQ